MPFSLSVQQFMSQASTETILMREEYILLQLLLLELAQMFEDNFHQVRLGERFGQIT